VIVLPKAFFGLLPGVLVPAWAAKYDYITQFRLIFEPGAGVFISWKKSEVTTQPA
jgi:hypothetical protein